MAKSARRKRKTATKPIFSTGSQQCYGTLQFVMGLAIMTVAAVQLAFKWEVNIFMIVLEFIAGVSFLASGVFACVSTSTRSLCHIVTCLVLSSFNLFCASVVIVLYPVLLIIDPQLVDERPHWPERTALLAAAFLVAIIEWCVAMCQIIVSYQAVRYMINLGYVGLRDPSEFEPHEYEASYDLSEQTTLLARRYQAESLDAANDHGRRSCNTMTTTALMSPSAPPMWSGEKQTAARYS